MTFFIVQFDLINYLIKSLLFIMLCHQLASRHRPPLEPSIFFYPLQFSSTMVQQLLLCHLPIFSVVCLYFFFLLWDTTL
ncbi:hypothetical protein JYU34_013059 [Plutella xylostella]|uniref:Uncharacterized protein n=1 Tax=Plutella xylostella TaxID=51655 RepID=A0ABQ7QCT2_PLUXY|nr:hypothetical protein JYU34_013059 [Plutella xylostella]